MKRWKGAVGVIWVGVLTLVGQPAMAVPLVSPTVSDLGGGVFDYSYEVTNPADSGESLFDFAITFSGNPENVLSPSGWDSIFGLGFIGWSALDFSGADDILPGAGLAGFSFESPLGPGEIDYSIIGSFGTVFAGTTSGPSASIPEPTTALLIGAGLAGLGLVRRLI